MRIKTDRSRARFNPAHQNSLSRDHENKFRGRSPSLPGRFHAPFANPFSSHTSVPDCRLSRQRASQLTNRNRQVLLRTKEFPEPYLLAKRSFYSIHLFSRLFVRCKHDDNRPTNKRMHRDSQRNRLNEKRCTHARTQMLFLKNRVIRIESNFSNGLAQPSPARPPSPKSPLQPCHHGHDQAQERTPVGMPTLIFCPLTHDFLL